MSAPVPPDPYRIKRILNKLEIVWSDDPTKSMNDIWMDAWIETEKYEDLTDDHLEKSLDTYLKDHSLSGWKS